MADADDDTCLHRARGPPALRQPAASRNNTRVREKRYDERRRTMYRCIVLLMAGGLVLGGMQASWAQPAPPPPPRPLAPGQPTPTVSGTVQQYLLTPHGEVEGLLLSDGTIVRFPPHLSAAMAATVKPGDVVTVAGFMVAATAQERAVKALTITNTVTGQTVT